MDEHTSPAINVAAGIAGSTSSSFESPEGLRSLLTRLHDAGPGAWRGDREAAELMRYTATKYRPLARKHGVDAWAVASAAFEVMLAPSTRNAGNPWAVVTRAVQISCHAETRAAGMLTSASKVRHTSRIVGFHDAVRFAERERLAEYHPAFTHHDDGDADENEHETRVVALLSDTVALFASAGWDAALVAACVEHVAYRLADLSSRHRGVEVLRRDRAVPMLLGLPPRSWSALLRIVLGHPDPKYVGTPKGDGVLLRLLNGESLNALRGDDALVAMICAAHPDRPTRP
ncbi:exopolyphosphatase [Brevibacterium sp. 50QC2O2]|uniref:exopolyphosphatase n=1 Tax=unclassified Brevibacterium TaxID=2614124 RepID=UPI00211C9FBC|nr:MULTISPECIES: exopolyphosphatase [unclassified Brevibacterium]MCQ9367591.1 exopolyphosphatase [Brevibacterium sp. 91QC2O2]MCQ9389049.1 exopolyphosphatase [Brevibacterium sp. 50QC2O2]